MPNKQCESLTLWTWFLGVSHSQRPCFRLFSVSVVPLWCIHILMIDCEKTIIINLCSNLSPLIALRLFKPQYVQTDRTHSDCAGRSWQRCWWAQTMCHGLFSCSSALPEVWPLPPLWRWCFLSLHWERNQHQAFIKNKTAWGSIKKIVWIILENLLCILNAKIHFRNPTQHLIG